MTDTAKTIRWSAQYYPFGTLASENVSLLNNLRFPGQYHDRSTGLYYNMFRHYRPDLGRYTTPDPIGLAGGVNVYGYAGQNPVGNADWSGLTWRTFLEFFGDWVIERGDTYRDYEPNSVESREMQNSPGARFMRSAFVRNKCRSISLQQEQWYSTLQALIEVSWRLGNTSAQVGSFAFAAANNGDGTVTHTIVNNAGRRSWFQYMTYIPENIANLIGLPGEYLTVPDIERGSGGFVVTPLPLSSSPILVPSMGGTIYQTFTFTEPLPCECQ